MTDTLSYPLTQAEYFEHLRLADDPFPAATVRHVRANPYKDIVSPCHGTVKWVDGWFYLTTKHLRIDL